MTQTLPILRIPLALIGALTILLTPVASAIDAGDMDPHLPDEAIIAAMRFRAFTRKAEDKKEWEELSDWFQVVLNSAGFLTKSPSKYPDLSELPDDVQKSVEENIPFYQQMYEKRLRP